MRYVRLDAGLGRQPCVHDAWAGRSGRRGGEVLADDQAVSTSITLLGVRSSRRRRDHRAQRLRVARAAAPAWSRGGRRLRRATLHFRSHVARRRSTQMCARSLRQGGPIWSSFSGGRCARPSPCTARCSRSRFQASPTASGRVATSTSISPRGVGCIRVSRRPSSMPSARYESSAATPA